LLETGRSQGHKRWPPQVWWWSEFQREYKRCGVIFNVDGPGPAGDGILIEKDFSGLILSRSRARPRKQIDCIASWAKKRHVRVRYSNR
jgi:hypothetical protein